MARTRCDVRALFTLRRRNQHVRLVHHEGELHVRPRLLHVHLRDGLRDWLYRQPRRSHRRCLGVRGNRKPEVSAVAVLPLTVGEYTRGEHRRHGVGPVRVPRLLRCPLLEPCDLVGGVTVSNDNVGRADFHGQVGKLGRVTRFQAGKPCLLVRRQRLGLGQVQCLRVAGVLLRATARLLAVLAGQFLHVGVCLLQRSVEVLAPVVGQRRVEGAGSSLFCPLRHVNAGAVVVAFGEFCFKNFVACANEFADTRRVLAGEVEPTHLLGQVSLRVVGA